MRKQLSALMVLALAAAGAMPAIAEGNQENAPQVRVAYADLNLATPAGMDALRRRVSQAVAAVCARPISNWQDQLSEKDCRSKAMAEALPQVQLVIRSANPALAMKDGQR